MPLVRPHPLRVAPVAVLVLLAPALAGCFATHMPSGHWSAEDAVDRLKIPPASCGVLLLEGETEPFLKERDAQPYFEDQLLDVLRRTGIFTEVRKIPLRGDEAPSIDDGTPAGQETSGARWLLRFAARDTGDRFRTRPFCMNGVFFTFGVIPLFWSEDDAWVYSLSRLGESSLGPRVFAIEGRRGGVIGIIALIWGVLPNWTWGEAEAKTRERMAEHLATRVVQTIGESR